MGCFEGHEINQHLTINTMKLIIAGGRDYEFTETDYMHLDDMLHHVVEVVSGCCRGADRCGEKWAAKWGIPVKRFRADWAFHGNAAGPFRNGQMAAYADCLAVFPGGRGTEDMIRQAREHRLTVYDFRNQPTPDL